MAGLPGGAQIGFALQHKGGVARAHQVLGVGGEGAVGGVRFEPAATTLAVSQRCFRGGLAPRRGSDCGRAAARAGLGGRQQLHALA